MHFSVQALALTAFAISTTTAHPTEHSHLHRRQGGVDYSNPALYKDVNFATISYGAPAAPASTPAPPPPPPPPAAPAAPPANPSPAPAAAQKNTSPAPPAAPAGGSNSGSGKRGLAYNTGGPDLNLFDSYSSITWAYNWDSTPGPLPSKIQYVPLLFSGETIHSKQWDGNVDKATGPTKYLMSFNEPDQPLSVGGSNIPVGAAVSAWKQFMSPYAAKGFKLGSPAISNGQGINSATGQPQGLDWLKPFLQQCSGCPISFAPVHWYGCGNGCPVQNDIDSFKSTVQAAMDATKLPVWVTEFQCKGDAQTFLDQVLPWLDSQKGVERYSYFMVGDGILTNGNALSPLGQKYGSK